MKPLKGIAEIKIIGVIASVNHRISKMGKPFGSFIFEDLTGTFEMPLFGENYLNYKKFLEPGYYLFIKGRVDNRWGKEDDFEFKINSIEMLPEIREKYFKTVNLEIELDDLNDNLVSIIYEKIKNNSGSALLNFIITNRKEQLAISMRSSKYKVSITNEMLQTFDEIGLTYKLN